MSICEICGNSFESPNKYCSRECQHESMRKPIDYDILSDLYTNQKLSIEAISDILELSVSTVYSNLNKHNISIRSFSESQKIRNEQYKNCRDKLDIDYVFLEALYLNKDNSIEGIATLLNCSVGTINYRINKLGLLKRRTCHNKKVITCDNCHNCFQKHVYLVNKHIHNFCSEECRIDFYYKGGLKNKGYDPGFDNKLRGMIRQRDNHTCQSCGKTSDNNGWKLSVHHIDYDRNNSSLDNLITLCKECHGKTTMGNREHWIQHFRGHL